MSTQRIDDFGEVIHGARKDAHTKWSETMKENMESSSRLSMPLSKRWPEPNYATLRVPEAAKRFIRSARDTLGPKPSRQFVRSWENRLVVLQFFALELTNHPWDIDVDGDEQVQEVANNIVQGLATEFNSTLFNVESLYQQINMFERAYEKWGMENSLRLIRFEHRDFDTENPYRAVIRESQKHIGRYYKSDSIEALLDQMQTDRWIKAINDKDVASPAKTASKPKVKLEIISYSGRPDLGYHIGVKHHGQWQVLQSFADRQSARDTYMNEAQHEALIERYLAWREVSAERAESNRDRSGFDWRQGRSISPEEFAQTFGFRGVQFGNYVENARRQQELNETYDAFLDMAWALDVSPESLSLDGTLGLAFGARGRGGIRAPNAHYELDHRVINLTKSRGAGSLAHEWFHALDHYLMMELKSGLAVGQQYDFLTQHMSAAGVLRNKEVGLEQGQQYAENTLRGGSVTQQSVWREALAHGGVNFQRVKAQLVERSERLDQKRRTPYWSLPEEIGARAFESAVQAQLSEQGWVNDYLVNISPENSWKDVALTVTENPADAPPSTYPYPVESERAENMQHMTAFFDAVRAVTPIFTQRFDQAFLELEQDASYEKTDDVMPAMPTQQMGLF